MIDEEKFHHAALTLFHQRRVGANSHSFGNVLSTGNLRTWDPIDDRFAVRAEFRLAIWTQPRESHFNQTHPAIPRRGELLVVTIARHITPGLLARLDHARPLGKLMPDAINLHVQQLREWSLIGHLSFRNRARAPAHNRKVSITITSRRFHLDRTFGSGFLQPGSWAMGTVGISSFSISSLGVYSGGRGGGTGFFARAANSSGNFSTKLCVGHAHASPNAQMVRPAMLSPMVLSAFGSSTTPPPRNMRSVIFCIQSEPSRQGVHWPQLS